MALLKSTPAVGDGITVHGYSDAHAYTVTQVSKSGKTFWAQRDKATRVNRAEDIVSVGGFAAHVEHGPNGQQWSYERDPNGREIKFSQRRDGCYRQVGITYRQHGVSEGRREYYDYNF